MEPMWIIGGYSPTNFCKYSKIKTKTKRKHEDANIGRWDKASNKDKRQYVHMINHYHFIIVAGKTDYSWRRSIDSYGFLP